MTPAERAAWLDQEPDREPDAGLSWLEFGTGLLIGAMCGFTAILVIL